MSQLVLFAAVPGKVALQDTGTFQAIVQGVFFFPVVPRPHDVLVGVCVQGVVIIPRRIQRLRRRCPAADMPPGRPRRRLAIGARFLAHVDAAPKPEGRHAITRVQCPQNSQHAWMHISVTVTVHVCCVAHWNGARTKRKTSSKGKRPVVIRPWRR